MIALGRDGFLAKAPPFTGDILWEHLEILQKGKFNESVFYLIKCSRFCVEKNETGFIFLRSLRIFVCMAAFYEYQFKAKNRFKLCEFA